MTDVERKPDENKRLTDLASAVSELRALKQTLDEERSDLAPRAPSVIV